MKSLEKLLLLFTLILLLVGIASAVEVSEDTDTTSITDDTAKAVHDTQSVSSINTDGEVKQDNVMPLKSQDNNLNTSTEKNINKNTRERNVKQEEASTWSDISYQVFYADGDTIITLKNSMQCYGTIKWDKDFEITIDGQGHTIDGLRGHLFDIYKGTFVLKNITIINAYSSPGGAIDNRGGDVTIINCTFRNNTSTSDGGAIYSEDGSVTVINCTFECNTAELRGGVICHRSDDSIKIIDSKFINNTCTWGAGVIWAYGYLNVTRNNFIDNHGGDHETIVYSKSNGIFDNNVYNSTDIALYCNELKVKDDKELFMYGEDVTLNYSIILENPQYYDEDILEKLEDITLYINDEKNVTTRYENYTLSNLKPGKYTVYYKTCNNVSNSVNFRVLCNSEISLDEKSYDYYEGIKNKITLGITDDSGEKGKVNIMVKEDEDKYTLLSTCFNVVDGTTISTDRIVEELDNIYTDLNDSYTISLIYFGDYANPSSTEFNLNIIKQRNTEITYDILNNTEGNVQISIRVIDAVNKSPIPDSMIEVTGDIITNTTSGILLDTTLKPGYHIINVRFNETADYKTSNTTIYFNVEIDKDKKIAEMEERINNITDTNQELEKQNNNLTNTVNAQNTIITYLEKTNEQLQSTITNLNVLVQDQQQTINNLQNNLITANNKINTLNNNNTHLNNQVKMLTDENKALKDNLTSANNKITAQDKQISDLNKSLTNVNKALEEANKVIKELNNTINKLNTQLQQLTTPTDVKVTVNKITAVKYSDEVTITGTLTDNSGNAIKNTALTVTVNGKESNVATDSKGTYTLTTKATNVGTNNVTVQHIADDKYNTAKATTTFNVNKQDLKVTINSIAQVAYKENVTITGILTDANDKGIANTNINITINGKTVKVKTTNGGMFTYAAKVTAVGTSNVTVSYAGNNNYNKVTQKATFKVVKQDLIVTIDNIDPVRFKENVTISGRFVDGNSKPIGNTVLTITINGKKYTAKTNAQGIYKLSVRVTQIDTNNVTVTYAGNANYNKCTSNATFKAIKQNLGITLDSVKTGNGKVTVTGTFTDEEGKPLMNSNVKVTINGKTYTAKTDNKGIYTLTKPYTGNNITLTLSYDGNKNYNSFSKTTKLTV